MKFLINPKFHPFFTQLQNLPLQKKWGEGAGGGRESNVFRNLFASSQPLASTGPGSPSGTDVRTAPARNAPRSAGGLGWLCSLRSPGGPGRGPAVRAPSRGSPRPAAARAAGKGPSSPSPRPAPGSRPPLRPGPRQGAGRRAAQRETPASMPGNPGPPSREAGSNTRHPGGSGALSPGDAEQHAPEGDAGRRQAAGVGPGRTGRGEHPEAAGTWARVDTDTRLHARC